MTLVETTTLAPRCGCSAGEKLKINFYEYLRDRVTKKYSIPPLAELIKNLAIDLNLGCSYSLP